MTRDEQIGSLRSEVERIVAESGNDEPFDGSVWLEGWLAHRVPALDWRTPSEVLAEPRGFDHVIGLIRCMQSGTYC